MPKQVQKGLNCTFCGEHQDDVKKLIAGPGVYICSDCIGEFYQQALAREQPAGDSSKLSFKRDPWCSFCRQAPKKDQSCSNSKGTICFSCIDICNEILTEEHACEKRQRLTEELVSGTPRQKHSYGLRCSFCGKNQDQVKKLIAGPGVYICNECHLLCKEILEGEVSSEPDKSGFKTVEGENKVEENSPAFAGKIASGDVSTFEKDDFVVCKIDQSGKGEYKVTVLTGGPAARLKTSAKHEKDTIVIARYVGKEKDKIVLVEYQPS